MDRNKVCDYCEGRLDRPALFGCNRKNHREPTLAEDIVAAIERDFTNRRGLRQEWEQIDNELRVEIRDKWAKAVEKVLKRHNNS